MTCESYPQAEPDVVAPLAPRAGGRQEQSVATRPRFSLATLGVDVDVGAAPTIDAARSALGGRLATERGAGEIVRVSMKRGADADGVVICVQGETRDVWIGQGRFVRTTRERVQTAAGPAPALEAVAADARRFAAMREGDPVRATRRDGTHADGTLLEKCRYGALVRSGDTVLAVSFRRVAPAPS